MADPAYMEEHGIVTERIAGLDHITSTKTFSRRDWERMHRLNRLIHCYVNYGALRLMLHYLQRDHGIPGISFLVALMDDMDEEPISLLMNRCMIEYYRFRLVPPGGWRWLYEELKAYVARKYGLDPDAVGLATAWQVQEAVMPEEGRHLPLELPTAHDIAVYIREQVWARPTHEPSIKKLGEYGPSVLPISDPDGKCQASRTFVNPQLFHSTTLELASPVARSQWTHTLWNDNWQAPPRVAGIF
jgi:hypothetical protein